MRRDTRGFTLTEMLIATVVMGILGLAMTRILITDSRFVSKVEAMMNARQAARAAMNTMAVELQMLSRGGLTLAERTDIQALVPYAFGVLCELQGINRYAALVPTDSLMYSHGVADGIAWRNETADYTTMGVATVVDAAPSMLARCTDWGIGVPARGRFIQMVVVNDSLNVGDIFYLYQIVRYRFSTSVDVPGRIALWRRRGDGAWNELIAPFDESSEFRFFVEAVDTAVIVPPANLSQVTGLELRLVGASELTPQSSPRPPSFEITTRLNFLNGQ